MVRAFVIAVTAVLLLGATPAPGSVDYSLGVTPQAGGAPPTLDVEIHLRGDADGETRLDLPDRYGDGHEFWRQLYDLRVTGAKVSEDGPAHRVLRHKPNAKLVVRYRVSTAYGEDPQGRDGNPYKGPIIRPEWMALLGEAVFASPEGRDADPATFQWGKLPPGWRAASDLDRGAGSPPLTVNNVGGSITLAGVRLALAERSIAGGTLRVATFEGGPFKLDAFADEIARTIGAERAFWNDVTGPFFVGMIPLVPNGSGRSSGGTGRGDGFVLYATPGSEGDFGRVIGHEQVHTWITERLGVVPEPQPEAAARFWLTEGFTDFFTDRTLLRAGQVDVGETVGRMAASMKAYDASPVKTAPNSRIVTDFRTDDAVMRLPYQRGALLALRWDEEIRLKTGGQADLDDVVLRMRDHAAKFPAGQAPDVVTGLVSAFWVVAGIDLRPDIGRYVDRGEAIVLPEEMFDGCLQAAVTISPGFDPGFKAEASFAAKKVSGVRRSGPAWNSGLRDGMALAAWSYNAGDMTRMIELTIRTPGRKAKPRKIAYWPYGDVDTQTRTLRLMPGMTEAARGACGRKIGGLQGK